MICCFLLSIIGWDTTELVWSAGAVATCDVGPQIPAQDFIRNGKSPFDPRVYQQIHRGDIVWVPCRHLHRFGEEVLPQVTEPFVLLINDPCGNDESFPSDCAKPFDVETFLTNPYVAHVFAQNCDYRGASLKVSPFPIGIDFHTIGYQEKGWGETGSPHDQERVIQHLTALSRPTNQRKPLAFVDFHHSDTMHGEMRRYLQFKEDRKSIFARLLPTGLIEHGSWVRRFSLWRKKTEYAFSISPHGNGLDCHRTWEDLALGCIVIVKSSPLDPLYEGLPVAIIHNWSEITRENMDKWLEQFGDALHNPLYRERLTHRYWTEKILKVAKSL